ncbi:MAG: hypothetical protein DRI65_15345 [Chloroflexota bacterium]|nr:MAG: hypothetical protein DRI65_15345 [Chloroflexota bacterium]
MKNHRLFTLTTTKGTWVPFHLGLLELGLKHTSIMVLGFLDLTYNRESYKAKEEVFRVFTSISNIARTLGHGRPSVRRALDELRDKGFLSYKVVRDPFTRTEVMVDWEGIWDALEDKENLPTDQ